MAAENLIMSELRHYDRGRMTEAMINHYVVCESSKERSSAKFILHRAIPVASDVGYARNTRERVLNHACL